MAASPLLTLSPGSLFTVPICHHPSVALAAAHLRTVTGRVAFSLAGLRWRWPLGMHRVAPKAEVGAVVSVVERLARGWSFLSPRKPSDKPATWSMLPFSFLSSLPLSFDSCLLTCVAYFPLSLSSLSPSSRCFSNQSQFNLTFYLLILTPST